MAAKGKIVIDRELCKGCHLCIDICPTQSIEKEDGLNKKGYQPASPVQHNEDGKKGCTGCCMCATVCPDVAIEVYRAK